MKQGCNKLSRREVLLFIVASIRFLSSETASAWQPRASYRRQLEYISPLNRNRFNSLPFRRSLDSETALFSTASHPSSSPSSRSSSSTSDRSTVDPSHSRPKRKRKKKLSTKTAIKYMFQDARRLEKQGKWVEAKKLLHKILDRVPDDAHSHLALARLEARREKKRLRHVQVDSSHRHHHHHHHTGMEDTATISEASKQPTRAQAAFARGTAACPTSVHLWQAWAVYEESTGNLDRARELFETALALDAHNPYVCHALGLMEKKLGDNDKAKELFETALAKSSTAALVCSLGEIMIAKRKLEEARDLYETHLPRLQTEKDQIEVYLAAAWLEERYFRNNDAAKKLLQMALTTSPGSSLANVALARLEGRMQRDSTKSVVSGERATAKRLASACHEIEKGRQIPSDPTDGRMFNALANIEVRSERYSEAQDILRKGMQMYPLDHKLCQAAGKVEERLGNLTGARALYGKSLQLEPCAPTLVAYAMLEVQHPESAEVNYTNVKGLFEEALMLDPRHGPAYNAYGNMEYRRGNIGEARSIFERGVEAECSDAASLYHGYGKFELSLGNVEDARSILEKGLKEIRSKNFGTDSTHRDRTKFLSHTLGMLELNSNRPVVALAIFEDGIVRCGNSSRLLLGAALCEMKLGKEDAAREYFEKSVLADKKHAQVWQAWGVLETRAGNFNIASTLFQAGLRSSPKHGPLWHGYATLELRKGNIQSARILFAGGIEKCRNYIALYQGWATLEMREGNYHAARKLISEALTIDKKSGSGWLIAAQIEQAQGNDGLVSLLLRRGIECAPNDPGLYNKLGEYLVSKGKIESAREVLEQGMEFNPLYAPLYHSLAELEARVCNIEALSSLNKRAVELFNANALEPAPSSSKAFGTKIRAKRFPKLPRGVAVLAEKIVEEDRGGRISGLNDLQNVDPLSALDSMNGNLMESEFVGDLLAIDQSVNDAPIA